MLRHTSPISGVASNGKYIATAGYDNKIILWDAKDNSTIAVGNHDHLVNQCEFSSCGRYLISASSDYSVRIWQIPDMKLLTVIPEHNDDVESIAIHPNEPLIATASRDHYLRVFDFKGNLLKTLAGHQADVISVQWMLGTQNIISSSDDGTIRVWNAETGNEVDQLNNQGIQTDTLAISSTGIVYAGDDNGEIHLISKNCKKSFAAHRAGIKKIVLNEAHNKLISIGYDRKAFLWNFSPDGELELNREFTLPSIIWARSCAFHNDAMIVFATFGDTYALFDFKNTTWKVDHIQDTRGINTALMCGFNIWTVGDAGLIKVNQTPTIKVPSLCNFLVEFDTDILTGGQSGEIFNASSGERVYQHNSPLNCAIAYSYKQSNNIIIGTYTGEGIILERSSTGKIQVNRVIKLHKNAIKGIAVSGRYLFSVCATGAVAWHSLEDNSCLKYIEAAHTKIANGCVSLSKNRFASISRDLLLRIWDSLTFSKHLELRTPHTRSIKCIASDNNSLFLATGSYNGLIAIYDLVKNKWFTKRISTAGISSLCFDVIENRFIASSYDGNIYSISENEYA